METRLSMGFIAKANHGITRFNPENTTDSLDDLPPLFRCRGIKSSKTNTMPHSARFRHLLFLFVPVFFLLFSCKKESVEKTLDLESCNAQTAQGHLSFNAATDIYTYNTRGGGVITINLKSGIKITHSGYPGLVIDFWGELTPTPGSTLIGGNHESLNGKHVKDRLGLNRTLLFPDGTKLTMRAEGTIYDLVSVSILDIDEAHHFNVTCQTLNLSMVDTEIAQQLDEMVADGETSTFEITSTGLLFVTVYQEDTHGNKVANRYVLGELEKANPNLVRDFYDDPRLGHT